MTEPVCDYYATRIVQDLENDLYNSKERIQRLRRQNAELAEKHDHIHEALEKFNDWLTTSARNAPTTTAKNIYLDTQRTLIDLLDVNIIGGHNTDTTFTERTSTSCHLPQK